MKKGFSLIELMIAIVVIFIGFAAVVSMSLSAISSSSSSKAKLKATSFAQGILEKYRAQRDASGIASLINFAKPGAQTIDGVKYTPVITLYNLNENSILVEVIVTWTYKTSDTIRSYALLTNYAGGATVPPPYNIFPTWYLTPTALPPTATPTKHVGPRATNTLTPTPTRTPTPTPTPICKGLGSSCRGDPDCCNGLFCSSNDGSEGICELPLPTATPTPSSCLPGGSSCNVNSECCSGVCDFMGSGYECL